MQPQKLFRSEAHVNLAISVPPKFHLGLRVDTCSRQAHKCRRAIITALVRSKACEFGWTQHEKKERISLI